MKYNVDVFSHVGQRHPAVVCGSRFLSPLEAVTLHFTVLPHTCWCRCVCVCYMHRLKICCDIYVKFGKW